MNMNFQNLYKASKDVEDIASRYIFDAMFWFVLAFIAFYDPVVALTLCCIAFVSAGIVSVGLFLLNTYLIKSNRATNADQ